jgi:hypothetical protein
MWCALQVWHDELGILSDSIPLLAYNAVPCQSARWKPHKYLFNYVFRQEGYALLLSCLNIHGFRRSQGRRRAIICLRPSYRVLRTWTLQNDEQYKVVDKVTNENKQFMSTPTDQMGSKTPNLFLRLEKKYLHYTANSFSPPFHTQR